MALDTILRLVFLRTTTSDWLAMLVWLRVKAVFLSLLVGEHDIKFFLNVGLSFFFTAECHTSEIRHGAGEL